MLNLSKPPIEHVYKTLYIKHELAEKIERLAVMYDVSFNRVVVSIIEDFFEQQEEQQP